MTTLSITVGGGHEMTAPESPRACDSCGATDDLIEWESGDHPGAKVYCSCKLCWYHVQDSVDELAFAGACDDCGEEEATCDYERCGHTFALCSHCYQEAVECAEPPAKREAIQCEDCQKRPADKTFNHLDGRSFNLCGYCFQLADHEDDYGESFGSTPQRRLNTNVMLCECPIPCNDNDPAHCDLCEGTILGV